MMYLVFGEPGSGKSKRAEELCMKLSGSGERIYLATMLCVGDDGKERIRRHRKMRQGKGFITIECPYSIQNALSNIKNPTDATVLLECVSNLVANEMFECGHMDMDELFSVVVDEILYLERKVKNLVVVSNHFEPTGDEETDKYIRANEMINKFCKKFVKI